LNFTSNKNSGNRELYVAPYVTSELSLKIKQISNQIAPTRHNYC